MIQYHEYGFRKQETQTSADYTSPMVYSRKACVAYSVDKEIRAIFTNLKIFGTDWLKKYKLLFKCGNIQYVCIISKNKQIGQECFRKALETGETLCEK